MLKLSRGEAGYREDECWQSLLISARGIAWSVYSRCIGTSIVVGRQFQATALLLDAILLYVD